MCMRARRAEVGAVPCAQAFGRCTYRREGRGKREGNKGLRKIHFLRGEAVTQAPPPPKGAPVTEPISQGAEAPKKTLVRAKALTGWCDAHS